MVRKQFKRTATPTRAALAGTGATVIDMSADPYDLSPAVNHIVTTVKYALAADQKIILMLGEAHDTVADVKMAELVRVSLKAAGIENPAMAVEQRHQLLEVLLPNFFPDDSLSTFRTRAAQAVSFLKIADPNRYHRLQILAYAALDWSTAPMTRLGDSSTWHDDGPDVRLIDMARTVEEYLDYADPATKTFVDTNVSSDIEDKTRIHMEFPEGVRLRNKWMVAQLRSILAEGRNRVAILQTGSAHLGGWKNRAYSYPDSLHGIFAEAANDNIRIISVLLENYSTTFKNLLSNEALEAMNNPDTIIMRGQNRTLHWRKWHGSFEEEIETLARISGASFKPHITTEADYHALRGEFERRLKKEVRAITKEFAPSTAKKSRRPEYT